jgi:hypothetical protein
VGRLLIPFLQKGCYFAIEPSRWLIEEALDCEHGRDILAIKKPAFAYNADFSVEPFDTKFDNIVAQSMLAHTGPDLLNAFLKSASGALFGLGTSAVFILK